MTKARIKEITFRFRFPAGTSRGILTEKKSWFIILEKNSTRGIGECSVIPGLSPDNSENYLQTLKSLCNSINIGYDPASFEISGFPSINFGLETAVADLAQGGNLTFYNSGFSKGRSGISINGLVWMGEIKYMEQQVKEKIEAGFHCIKIKIGALDFNSEIEFLKKIRKEYPEIEIRLDANGAFSPENALEKLKRLSQINIHSLEQPIKPGHIETMAELCEKSPVPIALDEELIGIAEIERKKRLLHILKPKYIILKPSFTGGLKACEEWIRIAGEIGIKWWITSALESNIGLNVIAQWAYSLGNNMVQGLGTGQIYENNISSPLVIRNASLYHDPLLTWDLNQLNE